ncbi:MAG: hypothetical protein HZC49_02230 [Nitrospirae bacterium]|nr:hypothetical protein [Nitrospirota bacterium]
MVLNDKNSKHLPYTDEEINKYCESVEKLLVKIKEDSLSKKRRKVKEIIVEEEPVTADEDDLVLS